MKVAILWGGDIYMPVSDEGLGCDHCDLERSTLCKDKCVGQGEKALCRAANWWINGDKQDQLAWKKEKQ